MLLQILLLLRMHYGLIHSLYEDLEMMALVPDPLNLVKVDFYLHQLHGKFSQPDVMFQRYNSSSD